MRSRKKPKEKDKVLTIHIREGRAAPCHGSNPFKMRIVILNVNAGVERRSSQCGRTGSRSIVFASSAVKCTLITMGDGESDAGPGASVMPTISAFQREKQRKTTC